MHEPREDRRRRKAASSDEHDARKRHYLFARRLYVFVPCRNWTAR
jgi:hypothetical protein